MKRHRKKTTTDEKLRVNPELEGLDININSLGEINSNIGMDKINEFLNKHVEDKKLKERKEKTDR